MNEPDIVISEVVQRHDGTGFWYNISMMNKTLLTQEELSMMVFDTKYKVEGEAQYISRCIDGRYEPSDNLPALAYPGADAGELALILATAHSYGFPFHEEVIYDSLVETVGGEKNLHFHFEDCDPIRQLSLTPQDFSLEAKDVEFIRSKITEAVKKVARQVVLQGEHEEGAVIYVKGIYGIQPRYLLKTEHGESKIAIFTYHTTLVNERHKLLAQKLVEKEALTLPTGCNHEYLYQALSEMADTHTLEILKRISKDLPIFQVTIEPDSTFKINDLGKV